MPHRRVAPARPGRQRLARHIQHHVAPDPRHKRAVQLAVARPVQHRRRRPRKRAPGRAPAVVHRHPAVIAIRAGVAAALHARDRIERQIQLRVPDRHHGPVARNVQIPDKRPVAPIHVVRPAAQRHRRRRMQRRHPAVVDLRVAPARAAAEHPARRVAPAVDVFVARQRVHVRRRQRRARIRAGHRLRRVQNRRTRMHRNRRPVVAHPHPVAEVRDRLHL